ncbi:MAG: hypothetical protein KGY60_05470 [Bacteroidales bacterium]|nr:hypothetical protein [Bacteroidales bacterium]
MKASMNYQIERPYQVFSKRILRVVVRKFYLYIPDLVLITLLVIPPYKSEQILMIVTGLVILGFRDLVLMRRSIYYLNQFKVEEQSVKFSLIRYNEVVEDHENHIANVDIEKGSQPFRLIIKENNQVVHQQYAIGYWTKSRLNELYEQFHNLKQDVTLESMFKGHMMN